MIDLPLIECIAQPVAEVRATRRDDERQEIQHGEHGLKTLKILSPWYITTEDGKGRLVRGEPDHVTILNIGIEG